VRIIGNYRYCHFLNPPKKHNIKIIIGVEDESSFYYRHAKRFY